MAGKWSSPYVDQQPWLSVTLKVQGSKSALATTFRGRLDTGFDGGLSGNLSVRDELTDFGYVPMEATVELGDNRTTPAWIFSVELTEISDGAGKKIVLSAPVTASLVCWSDAKELVGLESILDWRVQLNGPAQSLEVDW